VRIQILEDGRIGTVELTVSSGYRELDNLAIGAVKQWLYDPGTTEYRTVRVNFKLR
jgi:TonB family protein